MDSLASLALATEPPQASLLDRQPYGKKRSILSNRIWRFILSSAFYQIIVLIVILYGADVESEDPLIVVEVNGREADGFTDHYTMVFTTFVFMQIFNEMNSRMLKDEINVFEGVTKNPFFMVIWIGTMIVQALLSAVGGKALAVDTMNSTQWIICISLGAGALVWGILVRIIIRPEFFSFLQNKKTKLNDEERMSQWLTERENKEMAGTSTIENFMGYK
jgi:Ca2+ transporting ATPase